MTSYYAWCSCCAGCSWSRSPGCALDGADNPRIGAAAAEIAVHVLDDLRTRGLLVAREQVGRLHDLSGLAVAALRHLLRDPGALQRMIGLGRKPFDGGDALAGDLRRGDLARARGTAVDMDGAGATQAGAAAEFGAAELEMLAHDPEQRRVGCDVDARFLAIDDECGDRHRTPPSVLAIRCAARIYWKESILPWRAEQCAIGLSDNKARPVSYMVRQRPLKNG